MKTLLPMLARPALQGQGDQIAEAAERHGVLARKEAIIGGEADFGAPLHRLRDHRRAELPGGPCGDRLGEEDPDMAAVAGSGPFEGGGQRLSPGRCPATPGVVRPALLVEIGGKKPAGLVRQQRINAGDKIAGARIAAAQMLFDDVVRRRDEGLMRAFPAFDLGLAANPLDPFIGAGGRIAGAPGLSVFPANRKDIGTAGE